MASENVFLFYALLMGIFITFVYDILRIFRRVVPHGNFLVSLEDIAFWIYCATEVFLLMYHESNGTLRWFAILGAMVGMLLYKKLVSAFLVKYVSFLLQKLLILLSKVMRILLKPFRFVGGKASGVAGKAVRKGRRGGRFIKKKLTFFLKVLKMNL
ncbi:MAG: spore cortex biosynthesis protein YabQ [Lachnospiraceae bacterium]|nr:spore cortex biosynthesis protein YabQ [Lachnospiraceae bacterium]